MKDGRKRERERCKKTEELSDLGLGGRLLVSGPLELVFLRTTRAPGDAFNGPGRTDTDLMRQ